MKLNSLYNYFQVYFNYPTTGNVRYGRAISDVMKVTNEMMEQKSINPMLKYENYRHNSKIARKLLYTLIYYAKIDYDDPFNEIKYINTDICINKGLLKNGRKELKIPFRCGIDIKTNTMIILVFSSKYDIKLEMEVLKGLFKEFGTVDGNFSDIEKVVYWNLSKIDQEKINFKTLIPVSREKLICAANKAIEIK